VAGLTVLYEDNHLLVVDKPAGLLVQGGDAHDGDNHLVARASAWLKQRYAKPGNVYLGLVHRLDRNTSGVVVLAKTSKAAERLSKAFATRAVDKRYLAVVAGHAPDDGRLEHDLVATSDGGSRLATAADEKVVPARLVFSTRARTTRGEPASLLEVRLETGRKHQIRVQLAAAGHALLGDRRYAPASVAARFHRPALHAWAIALRHPVRGDEMRFVALIPEDLSGLLGRLGWPVTALDKNGT